MQLTEKYRPKQWSEVIGQNEVLAKINVVRQRSLTGKAFWISGKSGTGKTTIARLIAADVADDFSIEEIDAGDCNLARLRELEVTLSLCGFGKGGRAVIVNEAHGIKKDAFKRLLVMLERIPSHVVWIFTTTCEGQENLFEENIDASPFLSRCIRLDLAQRDLAKAFAERAQQIALSESLGMAPLATVIKLVQTHRNNFRAVLQAVEAGALLA